MELPAQSLRENIELYTNANPVNVSGLRTLGTLRGGFGTRNNRRRVWPLLLPPAPPPIPSDSHPEADQVSKDTARSLWRFTQDWSSAERERVRIQLTRVIIQVLHTDNKLHYYQGFHDIVSVLLLVFEDEALALKVASQLAHTYLRDFFHIDLTPVQQQLRLLFPLIKELDEEVYRFIIASNVEPIYCLSWIITWYSYNLDDLDIISRLFDFFFTSHPLAPLYLAAVITTYRKSQLLALECEFSAVHSFLSKLPPAIPFEELLEGTQHLLQRIPPSELLIRTKFRFPRDSVIHRYPFDKTWLSKFPNFKSLKPKLDQLRGSSQLPSFGFLVFFSVVVTGYICFLNPYSRRYIFRHIGRMLGYS